MKHSWTRTSRQLERCRRVAVVGVIGGSLLTCQVDQLVGPADPGVPVVAPAALVDSAAVGSTAQRVRALDITSASSATLAWTATRTQGSAWLVLSATSGTAPSSVTLTLNPADLPAGVYYDTLVIGAGGSARDPTRIPIRFAIHPCLVDAVQLGGAVTDSLTTSDCVGPRRAERYAQLFGFTGAAGDSVTVQLVSAAFAGYLVLDLAAGGNGTPLAESAECRGTAGDPCLTYVRLPQSGSYVIQATTTEPRTTGPFELTVTPPRPPPVPSGAGQMAADSVTPIAVGGAVPATGLVLQATVSDPDVGDQVALEVEVRRVAEAFTGQPTHASAARASGTLAQIAVNGLADDSTYRWQARVKDQTGRVSGWMSFGGNDETSPDYRVAVPQPPADPTALGQFRSDDTPLAIGDSVGERTMVFRGTLSDPDPGDLLRLEVEVQPVGTPFTGTPTGASVGVASGTTAATTLAALPDNQDYHWQARTADQNGQVSGWVSFGGNAETERDFRIAVPQVPDAPSGLVQWASDGATPIPTGGSASEKTVVLGATVVDQNAADDLRLHVEVRPIGTPFTNVPTDSSGLVANGAQASVVVSGLADDTPYHWQARAVDENGLVGPWTAYGGNAETATDFAIAVPAAALSFSTQPVGGAAGALMPTVRVAALEADGTTVDAAFSGAVTLAITAGTGAAGATLGGTLIRPAVAGVATFDDLTLDVAAPGYRLTASATGLPDVASAAFDVTPGGATALALSTAPPGAALSGAPLTPQPVVQLLDQNANPVPAQGVTVTAVIASGPGGGSLASATAITGSAGTATFSGLAITGLTGVYQLRFQAGALTPVTSGNITLGAGAATRLTISQQPSASVRSGIAFAVQPVLQIRDGGGNPVAAGSVPVTAAIATGSPALGGTLQVTSDPAGVVTFTDLVLTGLVSSRTLSFSASGLAGVTSSAVTVAPGLASAAQSTAMVPNGTAGSPTIISVQARDGATNPLAVGGAGVTVVVSGANSASPAVNDNGDGTYTAQYTPTAVGPDQVAIELNGQPINQSPYPSQVTAGGAVAAQTIATVPTSGTAGILTVITVQARDAQGNDVTGGGAAVAGAVSGANTAALSVNDNNDGTYTASYAPTQAGPDQVAITLNGAAIAGSPYPSTVSPGPVSAAQSIAAVPPGTAGAPTTITIQGRDANGNDVTVGGASVVVNVTGDNTATPAVSDPGTGTYSATYTPTASGTDNVAITLNGASIGGGPYSSVVAAGAATQLSFMTQPLATPAGSALQPAVRVAALDGNGNVVTSPSRSITVALGAGSPGGTLSGTRTVGTTNGVATFSDLSIELVGTGYSLVASSSGLPNETSAAFDVENAVGNRQIAFVSQPTTVAVGAAIAPPVEVEVRDALGNLVDTTGVSIQMFISGAVLGGTVVVQTTNGIASFADLTVDRAGTFTLTATAQGVPGVLSSAFDVQPAASTTAVTNVSPGPPTVVGRPLTVSYSVTSTGGTPTGNVTVSAGSDTCVASVAIGQCTLTPTSSGTKNLVATYAGDANFTGSASGGTAHQVNAAATTTTINTDAPDPSSVGQAYTVTYAVVVSAPGAGTPTGNVSVSDGVSSCVGTVAAGQCALTSTSSGGKTLVATYAGNANFQGSSSAGTPHQVNLAATTSAILSNTPDPSVVGEGIVVTYSVTSAGGTPTGTVNVSAGADSCQGTVAAGTCTLIATTVGAKTIIASYAGDANFNTSASPAAQHQVNQAATAASIAGRVPNQSVVGQVVTVTYVVSVPAPGTGLPTGNVTVTDGTDSCVGTVAAGQCDVTLTTAGVRTLVADYAGDANYAPSGPSAGTAHTVTQAATTTAITGDTPDPTVVGEAYQVSYTVTSSGGTPTGNVTVSDGTDSCVGTVASNGCTLTSTTSGSKTLIATYAGDANFTTSVSVGAAHTVNVAPTTTVIGTHQPDPSVVGQNYIVQYTVTSAGGNPSGNVTVSDGVNNCVGTVVASQCTLASTSAGQKTLVADYVGDVNFAPSTSAGATHQVNAAPSTTTITNVTPAAPTVVGQPLTVSVAVTSLGGTPTGSVAVTDGTDGCVVSLAAGAGSCQLTPTTAGAKTLLADYAGDGDFAVSSSIGVAHTVNAAGTSTAVVSSVKPSVVGEAVTFTATVSPVAPGTGVPTGTVQFRVDGVDLGGPVALTAGQATSSATDTMTVGTHVITAVYVPGTTSYQGSTGTLGGGQVVNAASTTTGVVSSVNPSVVGEAVTFTATVSPVAPGTGTPTGTVQFRVDGVDLGGPVALTAGQATSSATDTMTVGTRVITAEYVPAGGSYLGSTGTLAGGQVVNAASTTTGVVSSVNPSVVGEAVTFTATVSPVAPGTGTPTGTVQFRVDGVDLGGPVALTAGQAVSSATDTMTVGTHVITAVYVPGTTSYQGSTGTLGGGQVVNAASTTTGVVSSVNPSVVGEAVTFTATVSPVAPGTGTPTGTVQFRVDGVDLGTPVALTAGQAVSSATDTMTVGTRTVTAIYTPGTTSYQGSTGTLGGGQVVNAASTTTGVVTSVNPSVVGEVVTFTATVSPVAPGTGVPTGTVQFRVDGVDLGTPVALTAGQATSSATDTMTVGTRVITAEYVPAGGSYLGSTGTLAGGQVVNAASTTTGVVSSVNPSVVGEAVTFTATVSPVAPGTGTPTGTVQFRVDGVDLGTPVALTAGQAVSSATDTMTVGTRTVTAIYTPGTTSYQGSTGTLGGGQVVNAASTTTGVVTSVNPSVVGEVVTFTATVSPVAPGTGVPTGTVQFRVDGVDLGGPVALTAGQAVSSATDTMTVGTHVITAVYVPGTTSYQGSTGTLGGGQVVNAASTTTGVVSSVNPSVVGEAVTFTATVSPVAPGTGTPTGTVQFRVDGVDLGTPVALTAGQATSSATDTMTVGTRTVTAIYTPGTTSYQGSTGTLAGGQVVNAASTTTGVVSSVNPSVVGEAVTFTATVSPVAPGTGTPTGTVQFRVDGVDLGGPVALTAGQAVSSATDTMTVGTHVITAVYVPGTTSYQGSTGTLGGGQVVNAASTTTGVVSSVNPSVVGEAVTFTATVSPVAPGTGVPTGTVQFRVDGVDLGGPVALTAGQAVSSATDTMTVGTHVITAVYVPTGGSYLGSTGTLAGGQVVNAASSTTAITNVTPGSPTVVGQAVTVSVEVTSAGGTPTGTVQVTDGTDNCQVTLAAGVGSCQLTATTAGAKTLVADYAGDGNFAVSTSAGTAHTVDPAPTTTVIVSDSPDPSTSAEVVTITFTVTSAGGIPTGSVTVSDGGLLSCQGTLTNGTGSCTISFLLPGPVTLTATYAGDANFSGSVSAGEAHTVN